MTISPATLNDLSGRWRADGGRVSGFGSQLLSDVPMRGSRTYGALLLVTWLWRDECDREGAALESLSRVPAAVAAKVAQTDGLIGSALGGAR